MGGRHKTQTAICVMCGKQFEARVSNIKIGHGTTCSPSCRAKKSHIDRKGLIGENNPNWKGGISKDNYHYKKIQQERFPERARARDLVSLAIRRGELIKRPCEECGTTKKIHGHHGNYSKPLEVRWLCGFHHKELHKQLEKAHRA